MNITDVRVRLAKSANGKLKAVASITIDACFAVHDIKIIEGDNGPFIAMPSRKTPEGEFKDIAHPINPDARAMISELVLKAYREQLDKEGE
ncbi:MAG: septation regulator SpoVG [Clostridia bacterium]|nr:septation regulator SpoVG [Clostridia bacterium]